MVFKNVWKKRAMLCGRRKMASSQLQSETAAVHTLISDISHQVKRLRRILRSIQECWKSG